MHLPKDDSPIVKIARMIDEAADLSARQQHDEAWELLQKAHALARRAGVRSAFLAWRTAIVADYRQDAAAAVENILEALRLDPAPAPFHDSYRIIRRRLLATLQDLHPADEAIPFLFRLAADLGAVDADALMKYAAHAEAIGNEEAALAFTQDAVDAEFPTPERLDHLARLLERAGRHDEARARRQELQAVKLTFPCAPASA